MKRVRMAGLVVLAFVFCSLPGHAQNTYVTLHTVLTPGGTVNAVPKFITATHIGNSAITETSGNVSITGNVSAGGTVTGTKGNFSTSITGGAVSGTTGTFSGGITAGGTVSANTLTATAGISTGGSITAGAISSNAGVFGAFGNFSGNVGATTASFSGDITAVSGFFNNFIDVGNSGFDGSPLGVANNSSQPTLALTNLAAHSNSNFTEVQFNSTQATFFTDTLGDTTAIGTKSAAVPLQDGSMVKVFSVESPEVWFEDYGSDSLRGGMVTVSLDEKFTQTVNLSKGYHVFLTPKGDCKGIYVTNETETGFEVREMGGGGSSVEFDYRIVAHRKGYEDVRLPPAIMPKLATK